MDISGSPRNGAEALASGLLAGFSGWGLAAALVFSTAGLFYIKNGKSNSDYFTVFTGLALILYPCFVSDALYITLIGSGIIAYHYHRTH